jgi:hypothetical protein
VVLDVANEARKEKTNNQTHAFICELVAIKTKNKKQNMKKNILAAVFIIALFITTSSNAQVGIGVSTAARNPSAQLEVTSTTKGFLPPLCDLCSFAPFARNKQQTTNNKQTPIAKIIHIRF